MRGRIVALAACLGAALLAPQAVRAQGIDAASPLVCDLVDAAQCDGAATCSEVTPAQIQLPAVFHIDFAAHQLASVDAQRTSPIAKVETLENVLLLQGSENGRGWTIVIDRATGHLSASVTGRDGSFAVAGACTVR